MYVRLGFAVAVNVDPEILLVDEVLAVGDEAVPAQLRREDRRVPHAHRTIVFVSHGLGAGRALCDGPPGSRRATCGWSARRSRSSTSTWRAHEDRRHRAARGSRWAPARCGSPKVELLDGDGQSGPPDPQRGPAWWCASRSTHRTAVPRPDVRHLRSSTLTASTSSRAPTPCGRVRPSARSMARVEVDVSSIPALPLAGGHLRPVGRDRGPDRADTPYDYWRRPHPLRRSAR